MSKLTESEIGDAVRLLAKLEPGFLPYPIFEQVARLVALPIVEFIPLSLSPAGTVEVLLIERSADDPIFAGMLHTPGTVIRATDVHGPDRTNWPAFHRIMENELKGTKASAPYYVGSIFHESKRGTEQAQLYWVEVLGEPKVGAFYDVANMPEKTMGSQRDFIRQAAESFSLFKATA